MAKELCKESMPIILDEAFAYYDEERLETVEMIVNKLLDGFRQVSEADDSEPVMENTETLFPELKHTIYQRFIGLNKKITIIII